MTTTARWETRRRHMDAAFWERVDRSGGLLACWEWRGSRQTRTERPTPGYGILTRYRRQVYAHRRALELALGRALLPGEHALHRCDNPPCCNPAHLFVGSQHENSLDMAAKGRARNGAARFAEVCKNGHRKEGSNLRIVNGRRRCLTCIRAMEKRHNDKRPDRNRRLAA